MIIFHNIMARHIHFGDFMVYMPCKVEFPNEMTHAARDTKYLIDDDPKIWFCASSHAKYDLGLGAVEFHYEEMPKFDDFKFMHVIEWSEYDGEFKFNPDDRTFHKLTKNESRTFKIKDICEEC